MVENVRAGTQQLAFTVLGAYGYPAKGRGRVWALRATPAPPTGKPFCAAWTPFLCSLDTTVPPRLVITAGADEIGIAVRADSPAACGSDGYTDSGRRR